MFYKYLHQDALLQDLHNVYQSVQSWMICTMLNDLYYAEWFVQHVEWFLVCWMIAIHWHNNEWFALGSMICAAVENLYHGNIGVVFSSVCKDSK